MNGVGEVEWEHSESQDVVGEEPILNALGNALIRGCYGTKIDENGLDISAPLDEGCMQRTVTYCSITDNCLWLDVMGNGQLRKSRSAARA